MDERLVLQPRHFEMVQNILAEFVPQNEIWVFGSRAGGHPKPHSDLDLVIVDPPFVSESVFTHLKLRFEESDLPFRVDISTLSRLNTSFQALVKENHVPFLVPFLDPGHQ